MKSNSKKPRKLSRFKRQQINQHVQAGGLIAYPTEAVYGFGCDPNNQSAVQTLLALKNRSPSKGLIVIASNREQLTPYLEPLTPEIISKLDTTWPGPVTWLLPAKAATPDWLTGTHSTLACRVTNHPLVLQICNSLNSALVSTSANLENRQPCRTRIQVQKQFNHTNQLLIIAGATGDLNQPTTILDATTHSRVR